MEGKDNGGMKESNEVHKFTGSYVLLKKSFLKEPPPASSKEALYALLKEGSRWGIPAFWLVLHALHPELDAQYLVLFAHHSALATHHSVLRALCSVWCTQRLALAAQNLALVVHYLVLPARHLEWCAQHLVLDAQYSAAYNVYSTFHSFTRETYSFLIAYHT